jgi:lipopolysaccharide transport system permease protein
MLNGLRPKIMKNMWQYRELIKNLTLIEIKNRYQNTALGFFWSILGPFLLAFVLYFVFRKVFKSDENYAANLVLGLIVWRFFTMGTPMCLNSIVSRANLVTKVFFPRYILVLSTLLANLFTSILELIVVLPIIFWVTGQIPVTAVLFPLVSVLYFWLVYGIGLMLAAFYVYFRDLAHIWDVMINILFFCSPIIYPITVVPGELVPFYLANPLTQIIFIYRDVMVAGTLPSLNSVLIVIGFGALFFVIGGLAFQKLQRRFAEEI